MEGGLLEGDGLGIVEDGRVVPVFPGIVRSDIPPFFQQGIEVFVHMGGVFLERNDVRGRRPDQFGEAAPYERLLAKNGITVENIVSIAKTM